MTERARRFRLLALVVAVGVALDQITKQLADAHLRGRGIVTVIDGFLELRYARNPGAFFSLGAELDPSVRRVFFVVASLAATALIVRIYTRTPATQGALRWALVLLLAGAVGNLIDRALSGEVIDFVHMYWRGVFDWATFNVADVLITAGLAFIVADMFLPRRAVPLETVSHETVSHETVSHEIAPTPESPPTEPTETTP
jgi:signal peptidase II